MTIGYRLERLGRVASKIVDRYLAGKKISEFDQLMLIVYGCYETTKIIDEFMSLKNKEYKWKKKTYFKNVDKKKKRKDNYEGFVPKF